MDPRRSRVGLGAARRVRGFAEKPSRERADALFALGAIWNTFIFSGPARSLWRASRRALPGHVAIFEAYADAIGTSLERVAREIAYAWLEPASFSSAVLARTPGLVVIRADGCGWSDLGTPGRVFAVLGAASVGAVQASTSA